MSPSVVRKYLFVSRRIGGWNHSHAHFSSLNKKRGVSFKSESVVISLARLQYLIHRGHQKQIPDKTSWPVLVHRTFTVLFTQTIADRITNSIAYRDYCKLC